MITADKPKLNSEAPVNELISKRWSPRAFSPAQITDEEVKIIFESGRWAASSFNEQPWRFIYGHKGEDSYQKILDSINEFNQSWASAAPVLIVGIAKKTFTANSKTNNHSRYDLGAAVAQMTIQAAAQDIYFHQMAGFAPSVVAEHFGLDEDFEPVVVIAVGRLGDSDQLSEKLAQSETAARSRKSQQELVFKSNWKNQ